MFGALECAEKFQLQKIGDADVKGSESDMLDRNPTALSQKFLGYLNLPFTGTKLATQFSRVPKLNGFEAWRRLVVPLRPRNDAARNAMHVHNPPRSKDLSTVIEDLDA